MAQDPERTAAARQACGDDELCLFDYLAVSPELGAMTMEAGNTFDDNLANLGIDLSLATLFVLLHRICCGKPQRLIPRRVVFVCTR